MSPPAAGLPGLDPGAGLLAALVSIAALLVVLAGAVVARRASRRARARRLDRLVEPLRPLLIELAAADEPDPELLARLDALDERSWRQVEVLLAGLLGKVRGDALGVLVQVLERRGTLERARRRTRSRRVLVRGRAAELLGVTGSAPALPDLLRLLADRDADVRTAAARAVGRLRAAELAPALLACLHGPRTVPAGVVAHALVRMGAPAHAALVAATSSPVPTVRAVAVEILGRTGAVTAVPAILAVLAADPSVEVRLPAARALGRLGLPAALEPLLAATAPASDPAVRAGSARALGDLADPRAVGRLVELLAAPEHAVASAAARSLLRLGPVGHHALDEVRRHETESPAGRHAASMLAGTPAAARAS